MCSTYVYYDFTGMCPAASFTNMRIWVAFLLRHSEQTFPDLRVACDEADRRVPEHDRHGEVGRRDDAEVAGEGVVPLEDDVAGSL